MPRFFIILCAALLGVAIDGATAHADGAPPLSPAAGWATAYLVNAAVLAEYDAGMAAVTPDARKAAQLSPTGQAIWRRAAFAMASLKAKSQSLPDMERLQQELNAQALLLKNEPGFKELSAALAKAGANDAAPDVDAQTAAGQAAVAASFNSDSMKRLWTRLTRAYALATPTCPIDVKDVAAFASQQKTALTEGRAPSASTLLTPIAGWDLPKVQCLVFALMASSSEAKTNDGFEPVHLMLALQNSASPLGRDASLKALTAVRLMQLSRYAETLALIMDLTDLDEAFRLPYELVQRVFSLKQKGEGAVALQGL